MADDRSPWARPDSDFEVTPPQASPDAGNPGVPTASRAGTAATPGPATATGMSGRGAATRRTRVPAGAVTRTAPPGGGSGSPRSARQATGEEAGTSRRRPGTVAIFGWAAGGLVAIGLVIVIVMAFNGTFSRPGSGIAGLGGGGDPDENAPPLAKLCPPPTATHNPGYAEPPPPPPGDRTVDPDAGISYAAFGDPWEPWNDDWSGGDLKVHYRVGQHFVTEEYSGGTYHASILSGSVPATVNDGLILNLKCVGRQVVADVRRSYYPEPNRPEMIRDEETTLGGRPAWVSVFRLHFSEPGLKATNELVGVVLVDVGRVDAAVLYVSIPGTHREFDDVVEKVIDSVRPVE